MNNTLVIVLASLGGLIWFYAAVRERYKNTIGVTLWQTVRHKLLGFASEVTPNGPTETGGKCSESVSFTIESLEQELGIEPDHYLCDRIARINEALIARRDKTPSRKKGGAS